MENFKEASRGESSKELRTPNNSRAFFTEDYVIEEASSGGSVKYSLKYTGIYPPNSGIPYIFVVASQQEYDELGSLIEDIQIRDGNKLKSLDGRADSGYAGKTQLDPIRSQRFYRKITSKVFNKW